MRPAGKTIRDAGIVSCCWCCCCCCCCCCWWWLWCWRGSTEAIRKRNNKRHARQRRAAEARWLGNITVIPGAPSSETKDDHRRRLCLDREANKKTRRETGPKGIPGSAKSGTEREEKKKKNQSRAEWEKKKRWIPCAPVFDYRSARGTMPEIRNLDKLLLMLSDCNWAAGFCFTSKKKTADHRKKNYINEEKGSGAAEEVWSGWQVLHDIQFRRQSQRAAVWRHHANLPSTNSQLEWEMPFRKCVWYVLIVTDSLRSILAVENVFPFFYRRVDWTWFEPYFGFFFCTFKSIKLITNNYWIPTYKE